MYNSVIFDLDGTLLDTVADLANATNQTLINNGYQPLPEKNYNHYLGDGVYNLMVRVLDDQSADLRPDSETYKKIVPKLLKEQKSIYTDLWRNRTCPYPDIPELIKALKQSGAKIGVVSNKPHDFAVLMTEHFFGSNTFDVIIGHKENVPVKPAPDALYNAIDAMNIDKSALLYVGDTNTDMKTAANASVTSIGVTWGFRSEEELIAHDATFIVHKALEILVRSSIVGELSPAERYIDVTRMAKRVDLGKTGSIKALC